MFVRNWNDAIMDDDRPQQELDAAMQRDRLLLLDFDDETIQRLIRSWHEDDETPDPPPIMTGPGGHYRRGYSPQPWRWPLRLVRWFFRKD